MRFFMTLFTTTLLMMACSPAFAGFEGKNAGTSLKIFNQINCSTGVTCTRVNGDFTVTSSSTGTLIDQVVATATTITSSQCGSSFINAGAIQMELPEASTVLGCRLTFITGDASNFDVNPDDADQILVATNAAGDAIRNATLGNSITLEAISATQWAQTAVVGTYTDIN